MDQFLIQVKPVWVFEDFLFFAIEYFHFSSISLFRPFPRSPNARRLTKFKTHAPQVVDTIDGSVEPREDFVRVEFLDTVGSHYVKSITYGVEMVASLKFKSSSNSTKYVYINVQKQFISIHL